MFYIDRTTSVQKFIKSYFSALLLKVKGGLVARFMITIIIIELQYWCL